MVEIWFYAQSMQLVPHTCAGAFSIIYYYLLTTYSLLCDTDYRQSCINTYLLPLYLSVCSCQRTRSVAGQPLREIVKWLLCSNPRTGTLWLTKSLNPLGNFGAVVGLTGLEPVTLRLSSACSNQLSYRPGCFTRLPGSGGTKGTLLS